MNCDVTARVRGANGRRADASAGRVLAVWWIAPAERRVRGVFWPLVWAYMGVVRPRAGPGPGS